MKKLKNRQTAITQPVDLIIDTAILLQRVGVIDICEKALDNAIHAVIDAQALVTHAAQMYVNRRSQGLITFEQLMQSLKND